MFTSDLCSSNTSFLPPHESEPRASAAAAAPTAGPAPKPPKRKAGEALESSFSSSSLSSLASSNSSALPSAEEPGKRRCVASSSSPSDAISVRIGELHQYIATRNQHSIERGLWGFEKLIRSGHAYPEALAIAIKAMKGDLGEEYIGLGAHLVEALVEKGQGVKEAIEGGIQTLFKGATGPFGSTHICNLFATLFEEGEGFKEATAAAEENSKSPKATNRIRALELFTRLVRAGYAPIYKPALAAALQEIATTDAAALQEGAIRIVVVLLKAIVQKEQGGEEVAALAAQVMQRPDAMHRMRALRLFRVVVRGGYAPAYSTALAAATPSISCENDDERRLARLLLGDLLLQGYHKASEPLIAALKSRRSVIVHEIATLMEQLITDPRRNDDYPLAAVMHIVNMAHDLQLAVPFKGVALRLSYSAPKV